MRAVKRFFVTMLVAMPFTFAGTPPAMAALPDQSCTVNVLNRSVQVNPDGTWDMPNVPSTMGNVRARATCVQNGQTINGVTPYFTVETNKRTTVPDFIFDDPNQGTVVSGVTEIVFSFDESLYLYDTAPFPLEVYKLNDTYYFEPLDEIEAQGLNVSSSNNDIVSYINGSVIAKKSGSAVITARLDGYTILKQVIVQFNVNDSDGDGLPDEYELENGLNPNDGVDAFEDIDEDGLTALEEYNLGTNPRAADTDSDGIADGEEVIEGEDGVITNALSADTDEDGLNDGVEVAVGSDPNDAASANFDDAIDSVNVLPRNVVMTFNGIDSEVSTQLRVTGTLIDGSEIDLTTTGRGTSYTSSDTKIVSFGVEDGLIFGGQPGTATVTVTNRRFNVDVNVTVKAFQATALAAVSIPGYANNVDVAGDYAFVAAGSAGLQVVDVSNRTNPVVAAALDTDGVSIDVRVVGNLAYIADGEAGLKIIDVTDPLTPVLLGSLDTAGVAQDIAVDFDHAYLALGTAGMEIVDISNPKAPVSVSTVTNLGTVLGIDIENDRAVVAAGTALVVIDITDKASPMRLGSVNIGTVKDVVIDGPYAHVAAYSSGYRVVDISNPMLPRITGGDASIAPRDVELTRNFAFYAEQLFPNVVAYVNIFNPERPVFQGTINLSAFGDYAGTGIALDASYAYITEERYVVSSDYKSSGDTKLFIAQYRDINDNNGVRPEVEITAPLGGQVVVAGKRFVINAAASDDVAVARVDFRIDGQLVFSDTTAPYQFAWTAPLNAGALEIEATAVDLGNNASPVDTVRIVIEPDSDNDGLGDTEELVRYGTDPANSDTDGDGLLDGDEVAIGANPLVTDTDGDGIDDKTEVDAGTDPTNPDTVAPTVVSVSPADGATDVPENESVSVVFDEPLRAKSVVPGSLQLLDDQGNAIPGTLKLVSNQRELLFTPSDLLADYTLHTVRVSGVRDQAGNPLVTEFTSSYTTGNSIDTVKPIVSAINPVANSSGVPVNAIITAIMSEPIDPTAVTDETFYVIDLSTNQRVAGILTVSEDKSAITFVANAPYPVGRRHQITLTNGITDLFGNTLNYHYYYFTTNFAPDGTGPEIVATTFTDGAQGVPLNMQFTARFSEPVNALYLNQLQLFDSAGSVVSVDRGLSQDRTRVTLKPKSPLTADTGYQLILDGVQDLSGNFLPNGMAISFTTGNASDTQRGSVSRWSIPVNNTLGVPVNAVLEAQFNERVDLAQLDSSAFYLYDNTAGRRVPGQISLGADGRTLRFMPNEPLGGSRQHYIYASWNAYIYDWAGNAVNGSYRYFTTGDAADAAAPTVAQTSFPDGTVDVPVNGRIVVALSEPVGDQCPLGAGVSLSDGTGDVSVSVSLANDRRTITVTPSTAMQTSTDYTLTLSGLCDYAGNTLQTYSLGFMTAASSSTDTVAPTLASIVPANNATGIIAEGSRVVMTFSETVDLRAAPPVLGGGVTVAGAYEASGNTVTFTPSVTLQGNTRYEVQLHYNVADLAGNTRWLGSSYFTTEPMEDLVAPTVVSVSPAADAVDVSPGSTIVVTFDEPMNPASLTNNSIAFYADGEIIRPNVYKSADGQSMTLTANLPQATLVSLVMNEGVTDLSGNPLSPYISSFTTGVIDRDNSRPSVSRQIPTNGSNNWFNLAEIVIYMSEPMNTANLADAFHVAQNGALVQGTVEVLDSGQTIRFTADQPFNEGALINVYLESLATDDSGNAVYDYSGYFYMGTTNDRIGQRPYPTAYYPAGNMSDVPLNPVIYVQYVEALDPASVTDANVVLSDVTNGGVIASTATLTAGGWQIHVTPDAPLAANTRYRLDLTGGITDTDGDTQYWLYRTEFTTGVDAVADDRQPAVLALSPPNGEFNVGVNAQYSVRFDETMNPLSFDSDNGRRFNAQFGENNRSLRYERLGTLPSSSEVTENVPRLVDVAGNAVVDTSTTFTTRNGPDLARPNVASVSVDYNQQDVPTNPVLEWGFDEPLDPISVTGSGVYIWDSTTNARVPSSVTLSSNGKRLELVPNAALAPGRQYYYYAYYLRDLSGNERSEYRYFTTGFASDVTPPAVERASVFDGENDVPTNPRLNVRYSEPLNPLRLEGVTLRDAAGASIALRVSLSGDRRTVQIVPRQLLAGGTAYTLTIGGVEDLSGNTPAVPYTVTFITEEGTDLAAGSVTRWSIPQNNTGSVPLNAVIEVGLSERIDPTTINGNSFYLYDNRVNRRVAGSSTLSADGRTLRFLPDQLLSANTQYYLYVSWNDYLTDLGGNRIDNAYRYFTTGESADSAAPTVARTNLADGTSGVAVNAQIVIQFDERLGGQCPVSSAVTLADGLAGVPVGVALDSDRRTVTIKPTDALQASTSYTVSVNGVCDYAGNAVQPTTLSFTTSVSATADTTAPSLVSITPVNNATGVGVTGISVVMTFSEPVDQRSAPPLVGGGITVPGAYVVNGDTITFTPSVALKGDTLYTIQLHGNVPDYAGNTRGLGTRSFTTEPQADIAGPSVVSVAPESSAVDVDPGTSVVVSFSEPVDPSTLSTNNVAFYANGSVISPSIYKSGDGQVMSLQANLPQASLVSLVINDQVRDLSGNAMAPFVSSFTTGAVDSDNGRPRVKRQVPASGSRDWFGINEIILQTDEPMLASSIPGAFHVVENGVEIDGTLEILDGARTIRFTRTGPFPEGALVEVHLRSGATDDSGNAAYDYKGYFNMGSTSTLVGTRPYPTAYYPGNSMTDVALNPVVHVSYTEELDETSVTSSNVVLYDNSNGNSRVDSTVTLDPSRRVVRVTPTAPLTANTRYQLDLSGNIRDTDGDTQYWLYRTYFTTAADGVVDDRHPTVLAFSPPDGESNVGVNAQYAVRFDERMNPLSFDSDGGSRVNQQFSESNRVVRYERLGSLPASTEVTETVPALVDESGNAVVSVSSTFSTASGPDFVTPAVAATSLDYNQQNVPINPVLEWVFTEPVDPVSVTSSGVYLYDNTDRVTVPSTFQLSADGRRLEIVPNAALTGGHQYYYYAYYLRDLSGNAMPNSYRYFTTGAVQDLDPPLVLDATVFEGESDVPINVRLTVRFDEPLSPLAFGGISLVDAGNTPVPVSVSLSGDRRMVSIVPKQLLAPARDYTLTLDAIEDLSGNSPATAFSVNFTTANTGDFANGSVSSWSIPANNTENVPLNAVIEVQLSERIDPTSLNGDSFYLYDNVTGVRIVGSSSVSADGRTLTFTPASPLGANRRHYLYVSWNAYLSDLAGNRISGAYRYFTTGDSSDETAPRVALTSFGDGTVDVPVNARMVVVMSEPLAGHCPTGAAVTLSSGGLNVPISVTLQNDRRTLIATPNATLAPSAFYTLTMNGMCDYAGNTLAVPVNVNFTVSGNSANDTIAPTYIDSVPVNGATDVAPDTTITLSFNEQVELTSLSGEVSVDGGATPGAFSTFGGSLVFTPDQPFAPASTHSIYVRYIYDLVGNRRYINRTVSFTVQ